ncbi:MAG: hypothetical protein FJY07_14555, partial [Bacteroidetes bacterium]|nr:hypothetical protein [Bacteroidota bacterium]
MKKFTFNLHLLIVLILSTMVLLLQAQKNESAERAALKKTFNEDQLKILEQSGFSVKDIKEGILTQAELVKADMILEEVNAEVQAEPLFPSSSISVGKIYNPDESVTVTLGTGTQSNGTTGNPTPYGTYYKNFRQQYLILASELLPLGIGPGDIK